MSFPSTLDTEETTVITPKFGTYQERLRARCSTEWIAAVALYRQLDIDEKRDRSWNLHDCRTRAWFLRHRETGLVSVAANKCGLRWCPLCAQARANYIRHSVSEWLSHADHPKFLTLTVKHTDEPLIDQITKLYESFRRLRKVKGFKKYVTGGVWFFQICRNVQEGQWHPHLHCIITGEYIPTRYLQNLWHKVTVDSHVLKLQSITDPDRVAGEVARYASRPANLKDFGLKSGLELYSAMHGKRLCGKWGLFTKVELSIQRNPDKKDWEKIGSWDVVTQYAQTNASARKILDAYENRMPLAAGITLQYIDEEIDRMVAGDNIELTIDLPPPEKSLFDN